MTLYGGIEAGGTKFVCIIAEDPDKIYAEARFPTTTPEETFQRVLDFFKTNIQEEPLAAIGVACFGPVDLAEGSPTYGSIIATPKPGWSNTDVVNRLNKALGVPVGFDTDVNAAAVGEGMWGAGRGLDNFIYLTIGTGIGGGVVVNSEPVHGLMHPETGHIPITRRHDDRFDGTCPFHGPCFEGLATGPAIKARWGTPAEQLPSDHPAWELEAHYISLALQSYIMILSPQRIIMGGGVMQQNHLFPMIRQKVVAGLNGYIQADAILNAIDDYIVPPGLGNRAGVMGAVALAMKALQGA